MVMAPAMTLVVGYGSWRWSQAGAGNADVIAAIQPLRCAAPG